MADDPNVRGSQDRSRINVNQRHELVYWTKALGVSEEQLRDTVARVGVMADDVKRALGKSS